MSLIDAGNGVLMVGAYAAFAARSASSPIT
jgi:hypothetical protein